MKPVLAVAPPTMPTVLPEELLTLLSGRRDGGPKQLVIQTAGGLRRASRPGEGWLILSARARPESLLVPTKPVSEPATRGRLVGAPQPGVITVAKGGIREIALQGRGYGHQVGMCQAGAIAMGRLGWNYRQILGYYFSRVALRRLP